MGDLGDDSMHACGELELPSSELGDVDLTSVDSGSDVLGALAVDGTAEGYASAEDLLHGASGLDSH